MTQFQHLLMSVKLLVSKLVGRTLHECISVKCDEAFRIITQYCLDWYELKDSLNSECGHRSLQSYIRQSCKGSSSLQLALNLLIDLANMAIEGLMFCWRTKMLP